MYIYYRCMYTKDIPLGEGRSLLLIDEVFRCNVIPDDVCHQRYASRTVYTRHELYMSWNHSNQLTRCFALIPDDVCHGNMRHELYIRVTKTVCVDLMWFPSTWVMEIWFTNCMHASRTIHVSKSQLLIDKLIGLNVIPHDVCHAYMSHKLCACVTIYARVSRNHSCWLTRCLHPETCAMNVKVSNCSHESRTM